MDTRLLKPVSRNRKTYSIKTFFGFLNQSGYLKANPSSELIPPTIPQKERRFLSEEEYQRLLSETHASRDRAVLEVFLQTGMRLSEVANLNLYDLELPKRITKEPENVGMLKVTRKRAKEVVLPLNWKACEAIAGWLGEREEMLDDRGKESEALFMSKFCKRMTARAIRYMVKKYMRRARINYSETKIPTY